MDTAGGASDSMERRGIPQGLLDFFASPGGHSLIVRGAAGTGKTTFALQLAEELGHLTHAYYMSVRVSDVSLYNQFPWLKPKLERLQQLKVARVQSAKPAEKGMKAQAPAANAEKHRLDRTELRKLEGRIEMGAEGDESYGRVGEGEVAENTVVFDLGSDLPEVDLAYDEVEKNLPERTLVLIDSIDALSERYGVVASKLINTLQKDLVESAAANVVYVLESSTDTRLDYLGDGVLAFSTREHAGRRARVMTLEKLRGAEIRQPKYLYSLAEGTLHAFPVSAPSRPEKSAAWVPVPDPASGAVSTGNADLDKLCGGLPLGSIVALEVGKDVPSFCLDNLKLAVMANFVAQERGVAYVPAQKATAEIVREWLSPFIGGPALDKYLRIFEASPLGSFEGSAGALRLEGQSVDTDLKWSALEHSLPEAKHPYLSFVAFDSLESVYGDRVLDAMTGHLSSVRRSRDVFLGIVGETNRSTGSLASFAHVHLRLENIDGTVVLYGQKPFTGLHVLSFDVGAGFPRAVLHPVA